ncbi:MAG: CmcI family methyltransferase [Candidatus Bathyarchaeia archaeon]
MTKQTSFFQTHSVNQFHRLYYDSQVWTKTTWLGTQVLKCPLDMWLYQEIIQTLKPDLIIETGTAQGGSALFFASIMDLVGKGQIITIDIEPPQNKPQHPRITYLQGSSVAAESVETIQQFTEDKSTVLVSLDSDHTKAHVLREMELYGNLVTKDSYMVVEDTNINGHPVYKNFGQGPREAVKEFLKTHKEFQIDHSLEKFMLSFNINGYLKKT